MGRGGTYRGGGGHTRGGPAPVVERGRGTPTAAPAPPRESRREHDADAVPRMPKLKQQASPNFIASNKYGILPDEEDSADAEF